LNWAIPTAALVGVVAVGLAARIRPAVLRPVPAVLLCAAFVVWGTPLWSSATGTRIASAPAWKLPEDELAAARRILPQAERGDTILAPRRLSQTILVLSGNVTTVAPRLFYTTALFGVPGAHARERIQLLRFVGDRYPTDTDLPEGPVPRPEVIRALRVLDVDITCVERADRSGTRLLLDGGYSAILRTPRFTCLRAS
jgi:hypothetical protein